MALYISDNYTITFDGQITTHNVAQEEFISRIEWTHEMHVAQV